MKTLWRRLQIGSKLLGFIWTLIAFFRGLSKANKLEDDEAKKKTILDLFGELAKKIPYDLPGLIVSEFKDNNGGKVT